MPAHPGADERPERRTDGRNARAVRIRDFLTQLFEEFPESQRALLEIELADETLAAILPRQATAQSLAALIQNALDANLDQHPILITASGTGTELRIAVRDQGSGMPANVLRRIAEPFYTTKESGKGNGSGDISGTHVRGETGRPRSVRVGPR